MKIRLGRASNAMLRMQEKEAKSRRWSTIYRGRLHGTNMSTIYCTVRFGEPMEGMP